MKPTDTVDPGRCMKCGFCMSVCPIYDIDRVETHVARGRNMLIKMASENRQVQDNAYQTSLSFCLLCRRCESVCLAGLSPAEITIQARHQLRIKSRPSLPQRLVHRALVSNRTSIAKLIGMASVLPGGSSTNGKPMRHLADATALLSGGVSLPQGARLFRSSQIPRLTQPAPGIKKKGLIAVFPGCVFEYFMSDITQDMITAMANAGFEVHYPKDLTCCGQAVYNKGDFKTAKLMAERNLTALNGFDQVVTGCATCGSALKNYANWFGKGDPKGKLARDLSQKSVDFTVLLKRAGFKPPASNENEYAVTYHDPCHMRWHMGISEAPRRLLQSIQGVTYREMEGADACCGLGGAFGLTHRHIGQQLLDKKISAIGKTGAQTVVTACPGCMLNLKAGIRRHGLPVEVLHISKLMAGALNSAPIREGPG